MDQSQWIIFFFAIQVIHGLGTWKLYIKAHRKPWEAFVPIYNAIILMKIINRPWWWTLLMILPIVNLIMLPAVWVETARSFGKHSNMDTFLAIVTFGFYAYYLNYVAEVNYVENRDLKPKTAAGDWISSILFAIVAATIVHTYFFQPFVIPSSSLEKSLLVGDFLIVSKLHYGARAPMTTVAAPMVHDTIPILKKKSYLYSDEIEKRNSSWKNWFQLPYLRFPAFEKIERNDIVVFGQPADTLRDMNDFTPDRNYYKPIDKKTNLVKRCVGIAGDTLEVRNGRVYINGEENILPDRAQLQFAYYVTFKRALPVDRIYAILDKFDIDDGIRNSAVPGTFQIPAASDKAIAGLKNHPEIQSVEPYHAPKGQYANSFPQDPNFSWNTDFFGPLYIPKKGATININTENYTLYKRVIAEYEGHKIVAKGNQVFIDGELADTYTFEQDYYWMMGDNRHNSIDSRAWGFVPFNHVIGKPVFIWMSIDGINDGLGNWKPRTDRIFTTVSGKGDRVSYFWPFVIVVAGITFYNRRRKKKKAKEA